MRPYKRRDLRLLRLLREYGAQAPEFNEAQLDARWHEMQREAGERTGPDAEAEAFIAGFLAAEKERESSVAVGGNLRRFIRRPLPSMKLLSVAAAAFAAVAFTYLFWFAGPGGARVLAATGPWQAVDANGLPIEDELRAGARLTLQPGAGVTLDGGRGLRFVLRGPGEFRFVETRGGERPEHRIRLISGAMTVRGEPGVPRKVELRTVSGVYRLIGTTLRLEVSPAGDRLTVTEGSVAIHSPEDDRELAVASEGQEARLDIRSGAPVIRPAPVQAEESIESDANAAEKGLAPPERSYTEAELRSLSGNFVELRLRDGTVVRGAQIEIRNGMFVILTEDGKTQKFPFDQVSDMRIIHGD